MDRWVPVLAVACVLGCGGARPVTGPYADVYRGTPPPSSASEAIAPEPRWRDGPVESALATAQPHTLACASQEHRPFECTLRIATDGSVHVIEWTELDEAEQACATPLVEAVTLDGRAENERVLAVRWSGLGVALLGDR